MQEVAWGPAYRIGTGCLAGESESMTSCGPHADLRGELSRLGEDRRKEVVVVTKVRVCA